ncbi:uncharacterized protein LTR77_009493 [Saxophila tyrrhenica]|uniref:Heterokaryon incompatibility domain-containing protein n=1 Tax=Saxophila tyrrhenica TaxID=1690608 RepID=A0AAV9P0K1_9PEZI|nr:hypothetical protein LTR77_009493 [Saxophila tyrrhenica]
MTEDTELIAELQLTRAAQFESEKEKYWSIPAHPDYCCVCFNLDPIVIHHLSFIVGAERIRSRSELDPVVMNMWEVDSSVKDVLEAAADGCSSCLLLQASVAAFGGSAVLEDAQDYSISVRCQVERAMRVGLYREEKTLSEYMLFVEEGQTSPWNTIASLIEASAGPGLGGYPALGGAARVVAVDPASGTCIDTIKKWLSSCQLEHPWCSPHKDFDGRRICRTAYTPKRLLFLGKQNEDIRLVHRDALAMTNPEYAALSYCWGQVKKLTTTTQNLSQLQDSVSFLELIKTCQDTATLVRRLGIGYLWVDSLCIVQDDLEDWRQEAANMASVYAGASICIAASAGDHGDSGLFKRRETTKAIFVRDIAGKESTIFGRPWKWHARFDWGEPGILGYFSQKRRTETLPVVGEPLPLLGRGWAFQERLLSPRILHFTANELVWECLGHMSCECGTLDHHVTSPTLRDRRSVAGIPPDVEVRFNKLERAKRVVQRRGASPGSELAVENLFRYGPAIMNDYAVHRVMLAPGVELKMLTEDEDEAWRWRSLCEEYSRRSLSYSTDRLPAMAGLAATWADVLQERPAYLAGLWQHSLLRDLLWKYDDALPVDRRGSEYLAPTWSWANSQRSVQFLRITQHMPQYHASVLNAHCEKFVDNPYGQVFGGSLTLVGPCFTGYVYVLPGFVTQVDVLSPRSHRGETASRIRLAILIADCIPECQSLAQGHAEILILHVATDVNDDRTGLGWDRALALQLVNEDTNEYRRIGIAEDLKLKDDW